MARNAMPESPPQIREQQDQDEMAGSDTDGGSVASSSSSLSVLPPHGDELTAFDVFSLIVNKMIGTGIYNAPSSVLILTGSKRLTMTLWVLGFLYTLISMLIYLGYSAVLPYTGGELVYVDEITSQMEEVNHPRRSNTQESQTNFTRGPVWRNTVWKKVFGDGLLAYTVYSVLFVAFFNSSTNALQVGRETLVVIRPEEGAPQMDVLRYIAIGALSILCLIQYWSSRAGRKLNRWSAVFKLSSLCIVFLAGAIRTHSWKFEGNGFQECAPIKNSGVEVAKAMLLVIFSFEGWENATFVAGEAGPRNQGALRKGFLWAVAVVGCLYLSVVAVFLYAVPYTPVAVQFAPMLFGNSRAAYQAWAVLIALSSLGSMNSIIYTYSRIKQCVAHGNILPWSRFWKSDSPTLAGEEENDMDKSPKGGLWLHWIMSVILIAVSASLPSVLESISLPGLLQTYTHCIILMFIAMGALRLPALANHLKNERDARDRRDGTINERDSGPLDWAIWKIAPLWRLPLAILVVLYALANLMVIIVSGIPPFISQGGISPANQEGGKGWSVSVDNKTLTCTGEQATKIVFGIPITPGPVAALDGHILPAATFTALAIGILYYICVFKWGVTRLLGIYPKEKRRSRYKFGRKTYDALEADDL